MNCKHACKRKKPQLAPLQPCNHDSDEECDEEDAEGKTIFDSDDEEEEDENDGWFDLLVESQLQETPDPDSLPLPEDSQEFPRISDVPISDSQVVGSESQLPEEIPEPVPIAPPPKAKVDMDEPILSQQPLASDPSKVIVLDSPNVKLSKAERIAKLKAQLEALEDQMGSLSIELGRPIMSILHLWGA